jgi:ABC-2 type transport system ATP-binding protein
VTDNAIEVRGLRKSYGSVEAVRGIDLHVQRGECFALLGPNGAGKTTSVEIMEGHRSRDAGEVAILGFDPARAEHDLKTRIGIVLQETGVEPYLTVAEAIELYRGYYPTPLPLDDIIEVVGLQEKRDARVRKLSGGQQRRLDVAIGLAGDPDVLFLDEPTTGFDPGARRQMWQAVHNLIALGKTIFLTTHYMDEAQELAHRVAVIARGQIVATGAPATLGGRDTSAASIRFHAAPALPATFGARVNDDQAVIETKDPTRVLHELTGWALDHGVVLEGLQVTRPSLEDVYLQLTGDPQETA